MRGIGAEPAAAEALLSLEAMFLKMYDFQSYPGRCLELPSRNVLHESLWFSGRSILGVFPALPLALRPYKLVLIFRL